MSHLPAAGEMVLFDRSGYDRAGVERVMRFCSEADVEEFSRSVPEFERMLVRSGIRLIKYWFSISDEEQHLRFLGRTHIPEAPWWVVAADDKKRARLNCMAHLLSLMPYEEVVRPHVELPERTRHPDYSRRPTPAGMFVPERY